MAFASARTLTPDLLALVKAPRRVPVSRAAQDFIRVEQAGGSGPWSAQTAPYMIEPMDCTASLKYEQVIFCGPSRTGKTQGLVLGMAAHSSKCDPVGDMLAMFPTEKNAHKFGLTDLRKLHTLSPVMRDQLSPRAHDTAITRVIYRNGFALFLGHPTTGEVAQTTYRRVIASDYDSFPQSIGDEGDPFGLLAGRVKTFMSAGVAVAESSPKRTITDPRFHPQSPHEAPPTDGGIMALYNQGDRRMWYWRCLHCREMFRVPALPDFDDLPNIEDAARTARVICPHCACIHTPKDKLALQTEGARWLSEAEIMRAGSDLSAHDGGNRIASFWLLGCAAAFQSWGSLVANELRALRTLAKSGDEEGLKRTRNTDQGIPYLPRALANTRSSTDAWAKAEDFDRATVPHGGRFLVTTVDVQAKRFVVQVHAIGVGGEIWVIDRYDIAISERKNANGDPEIIDPATSLDDWKQMFRAAFQTAYPLADSPNRRLPVHILAVDSGGKAGVTERAYSFWTWASRQGFGRRVMLVKGDGNATDKTPRVRETWPDSDRKDRRAKSRGAVPVYLLNSTVLKDGLSGDLAIPEGPKAIHYAAWIGEATVDELTAEIRTPKRWEKAGHGSRNEMWDLLVYCRAALIHLGTESWGDKWERCKEWAREWPSNPAVFEGGDTNAAPPLPRSTMASLLATRADRQ